MANPNGIKIDKTLTITNVLAVGGLLVSITFYIAGQEKLNAVQDSAIEANRVAIAAEERARREAIAALIAQNAVERQEVRELFNKIEHKIDKLSDKIDNDRQKNTRQSAP